MLRHTTRTEKIAGMLSLVGIVTMPLNWVPLLISGDVVLEIPNVVSALFAAILPFAILVSKRMWRINLLFGLLLLWSLLYLFSMILHDTPDGIPILRQQAMQALFGWTLALSVAHSNLRISQIGAWALISLGAMLLICAALAGVNLFTETLHYALTGDRLRFIYWTMRPIFNVFVQAMRMCFTTPPR